MTFREISNQMMRLYTDRKFAEKVHPGLAHEFPADFGSSFDKAIKFILE